MEGEEKGVGVEREEERGATGVAAGEEVRVRGSAKVARVGPVMGVMGAGRVMEADWVDLVRGGGTDNLGGWEGSGEEGGGTGG